MDLTAPLLRTQHGVYAARQADTLGIRRCRDGAYPGTRIFPGVWSLLPPPFPIPAVWIAAVLYCGRGARLSGLSAASLRGWRPAFDREPARVVVSNVRRVVATPRIVVTRSRVSGTHLRLGVPVTPAAQTLADCAGDLTRRELTALTATALQRREVTLVELQRLVRSHPRLPGTSVLRPAIRELRSGADSIMELDCLRAFRRWRVPVPECQVELWYAGQLIAVADFWWDGVAGFYDGGSHVDAATREADDRKRLQLESLALQVVVITNGTLREETTLRRRLEVALAVAEAKAPPQLVTVRPADRA